MFTLYLFCKVNYVYIWRKLNNMQKKPKQGTSRKTKVVSVRLLNKDHSTLCKLAGGKTRLTGFVRRKLEDLTAYGRTAK